MPKQFNIDAFKHADPRFYTGKDVFVVVSRKDNSSVPPENGIVVPVLRRVEVISVRKGKGRQAIYAVDRTAPVHRVPGRI